MAKTEIRSGDAAAPGGAYSQAVIANGLLYTSGMGPFDPKTGDIVSGGIEEQTERTLANLAAVLREAGLDFSDVVKSTVHLQDVGRDFAGFNAVYGAHFPEPRPARTTVGSELGHILIEIDLVAVLRG